MSPALQSARNYYAWIASFFEPVLGRRILDIGGGHGAHLEHVVDGRRFVMSLDVSAESVTEMKQRFASQQFEALHGDITDASVIRQLVPREFDTILCINVLEHIEHDEAALRAMAAILRPTAGRLFLLVPAHPILYGTPDVLAGHWRRYRRKELRQKLAAAGFGTTRLLYFNGFGAIPYGVNSRIVRPRTLSGIVDRQIVVYDRFFVPVLRRLESWVHPPFGQSLVATAESVGA